MPTKVAKYNPTIATLNAGGVTPFTGFGYENSPSKYVYTVSKHGGNYVTLATYRGVGNTPFTGFYQNTTSGFIPTGAVLGISYAGITVSTYRNTGKTPFAGFFKGFTTHPITSRHFIYATSITITGDTSASKYREAPRTAFIDVFGNAIGDSARDIQRNNPASQNAINVDAQSVQVDRTAYIAGADFATAQENKEMSQVARATGYLATKAIQSRDLFRRSAVREQLRSTSGRTSILGRVASVAETVSTTIQKTLTFFGTSATSTTTTAQSWKNLSAVAYGRFYGVVSVVGESQQQFFRNSSDPLSETIRGLRFQADSKTGAKTEQLLSSGTTSSEKDRLSAVNETLSSEGAQSKSLFRSTFVAGHLFESNASKAIYNRVSKTVEAFISTTQKTLTFEGNSSVVIASESSSIRRFAIDALTQAYALSFSVATSAQQFVLNSAESIQSNATELRTLQYQRNNSIAETLYSATASKADRYKDSATSASSTVVASQRKTVFLSSRLLQSVFSTSKEFRVLARISSISESMVVAVQKSLAFDGSSSSVIGSESTSIRRFAGNAFTTSFSVSYSVAVSAEQFIASATQQLFESVTDQKVGSVSRASASSGTIKSTSAENRDLFKNSFASEQSFAVSPQRRTASLSSYVSESLISNAKFNVIVERASATSESLFSTIEKTALFVGDSSVSTTLVSSVWRNLSASPFGLASSFSSIVATTTQQFVLSSAEVLSETARSIRLYEAKRTSAIAETVSSSASTVFGFLRNSSATESPRSAGISAVRNVASSSVREVLRNTTASYRDLTGVSSTDIRLFVVSASNTTKTFTSSVLDLYSVSSTQSIDSFRASAVETISSATNDSRRSLSSAGLVGLATATSYVRGISSVGILASSATFATLSSSAYRIIGYERYSSVANSMSLAKHYLVRGVTRANLGITLATYSGSGNTPFTGFGFRPHLPMFEDRSLLEGIVEVTKYVSNATSELLESSIEKNGTLARISASTETFTSRTEKSTTNYEVGYSSGRIISSSWRAFTANAFNGSTLLSYVIGNSSNNFFNSSSNAITEVIRGEKYQTSHSTSSVSETSSVVAEEQRELSRSSASSENSFASGVKNIGMYRVSTATETLFTTLSSSANFSRFGTIAESLKSAIEKSALFVTNSTASIRSESSSPRQFAGVSFASAYALSLTVATSARNAVVSSTNTISQTVLGARLYSAFRDSTATETLSSVGAQNKDMYRDASVLENEFANALQSKDISRSAITATSMDATSEKTSVLDRVSKVTERFVSSAQKNALFVGNSSVSTTSQSSSGKNYLASAFAGAYALLFSVGTKTEEFALSSASTVRETARTGRLYEADRSGSVSGAIFAVGNDAVVRVRNAISTGLESALGVISAGRSGVSEVTESQFLSGISAGEKTRSSSVNESLSSNSVRIFGFTRFGQVTETILSRGTSTAERILSSQVVELSENTSTQYRNIFGTSANYSLNVVRLTSTISKNLANYVLGAVTSSNTKSVESDRTGYAINTFFTAVASVRSYRLTSFVGYVIGTSSVNGVTAKSIFAPSVVTETLSSSAYRIIGYERYSSVAESMSLARHILVRGVTRANLGITLATYSGGGNTPFTGFGFRPAFPIFQDKSLLEGIITVTRFVANRTTLVSDSSVFTSGGFLRTSAVAETENAVATTTAERVTTSAVVEVQETRAGRFLVRVRSSSVIGSSSEQGTISAGRFAVAFISESFRVIATSARDVSKTAFASQLSVIRATQNATRNLSSSVKEFFAVRNENYTTFVGESAVFEILVGRAVKSFGSLRTSSVSENQFATETQSRDLSVSSASYESLLSRVQKELVFSRESSISENLATALDKTALFIATSNVNILSVSSSWREFAGNAFGKTYSLSYAIATSARQAIRSASDTINESITEVRLYNASRSSAVESLVFASAVESRDVTKSSSTELLVTSSNTRSTTFSGVSYILQTMVSTSQEFREIIRDSSVVEFVMSVTASKETSSYPVVGFSFVGRTIQSFTTVAGAIRTITRDATVVEVPIAREEKTTTKLRNNFTTQSLSTVTTQARSFFRDSSLLELFSTSTSQKSLIIGVQGVTDIYAVRVIQAFATVATTIRNIAKTSAVEENNIVADQRTTTVVRSSEVSENLASSGASSIAFIGLSADVGLFVVNAVKSVGNVASSSVSEFFTTATNSARTLVTNSSPLIASIARNANYRISALSSAVFGFGSSMDIKSYEALRTGYVAEQMSSSAQGRRDLYGNTTIALASFVIAVRDVVFVASSPLVQNVYSVASRQQNVIKDGSTVTLYESAHANAYKGFAVLAFSKGLQTVLTLGSAVNSFQTFGRNSRITETPKTTDERTTSMVKSASISESMAEANYKEGSFFRYSIVLQELSSVKKIIQSSLPIRIANRAITIATYAGLGDVPFLGFTTPRSEVTAYLLPAVASVERVRSNRTVELFRSISESTRAIVSSSSVSENESVVATQYATRNLSGFVSENLSTVASQARSFFRDSSLAELLSASTSYKSLLIGVSSAIDNVTGRTIQAFTSVATSFRTSSENSAVSLSEETRGVSTRASIVVGAISEIYSSTAGKVFESVRLPSFATYFTTTSARTTTWFGTSANALTEVVIATIQRSQSASGYANAVAQTFYSTSQEFRVFFRDGTTRELFSSSTSYKSLVLGVIAVMDGAVGRTIQTLLSTSASLRVLSRVSKVEENQSVSEKKTTTLFRSNTTTENLSSVASQNRSFFRDSSLIELLSTTTSYKSLVIAVTSIGDVFVGRTIQTMASVAGVFRTIDRSNATSENEATTTANFTTRTKEGSTTENLSSVASQNRSFLRDSSLIELLSTSTSYKSLIIAVTSVGDVFVGRVIQLLATAGTITQTSFRNSNATENQHVVAGEFSTRVKNGEATETLTSTSSRSTGKTLISAVKESFASATEKSALFNAVARAELYEMPEAKKYREIVRSATVNEIMSSSAYRFIGQDKFGSASSSEFVTDGRTKSSNVSSASALDEQPTSFKEAVFFGAAAVIATILSTSAFFRNIIKVSSVEQFSSSSGQKSTSIRQQQSSISTTQAVTSGKYVQHTRESAQALRATVRSARRTFRTRVGESIFNEFATSSIFFLQIIHTIKTIFEEDALGSYEDSTIVYREKMEGTVFTEDTNFFGEDGVTFYEE